MNRIRMFSRIGIINILLAFLVTFFVIKTYGVWKTNENITFENQVIEKATPHSEKKVSQNRLLPDSYYKAVVEQCLFSPDRAEFIPEVSESEPEVAPEKIPGVNIILYGVVMMEDYATALVSNPEIKPGYKPEVWVRSGDDLGIFKVASIQKESILLTDGTKEYKIPLYDQSRPKQRSAIVKTAKPMVVTTPSKPKKSDSPKPGKPKPEELSNDQYEIIRTPFGNIKRRKK
jgi:type II secretory pathway component PulC